MRIFFTWIISNWSISLLIGSIAMLIVAGVALWAIRQGKYCCCCMTQEEFSIIFDQIRRNISIDREKTSYREVYQNELSKLPIGRILFNPPNTMKLGISERVEVRISRELYLNLRSNLKGSGFPQIEELKISELMKVRLSGDDFQIVPLNEAEQILGEKGFTEWVWDVVPLNRGRKVLHLHVTLRIRLPFGEEKKDHPVLDKEIYVQINPIYSSKLFVVKYWQWIASTLILPLAAWAWTVYSK
ncbi:MAG: hypothetical protein CDV28_12323 [Candidatus Electronema aureum]|uniref:Uncharacterized protein n=1 Tax=Candidatus Electronema aureum TaxID=2005002 RepID=A0A521G114_9BACT|nr:MAG: hypothetical protein CDV28_12323 [Candidatus Electronema aureum]